MSRADKQSPHSSPRLSRRSVTPNVCSTVNLGQTNDIYASQLQQQQQQQQLATTHSLHSLNSNQLNNSPNVTNSNSNSNSKGFNATRNSAGSLLQSVNFSQVNLNRMSAPLMPTSSASMSNQQQGQQQQQQQQQQLGINKLINKTQSADINEIVNQDPAAPPLPPRKSSPCVDNSINRQLKPGAITVSNQVNTANVTNPVVTLSRSSENITTCELEVPKTNAPPVPKHKSIVVDDIGDELQHINFSPTSDDHCEKVIVGPAETITGIIDTRPLDARKPIVPLNSSSTDKEQIQIATPNGANLYHLKVSNNQALQQLTSQSQQQQNQARHQSFPNTISSQSSATATNQTTIPTKSQTTPHLGLEYVKLSTTSSTPMIVRDTTSSASSGPSSSNNSQGQQPPLLYENITINTKDCNVPYENINLEYIARLMKEGYSKENVITALGISRNNIEMACDILHEFVSKSGA